MDGSGDGCGCGGGGGGALIVVGGDYGCCVLCCFVCRDGLIVVVVVA